MRLLLDEDSQGRLFVRRLKAAGHDVETVMQIITAIGNIEASGWDIASEFVAIHAWR
jgi:hypothetical protein